MGKLNVIYRYCLVRLGKRSINALVFLFILFEVINTLIFSKLLFPNHTPGPKFSSVPFAFLSLVIFAPLVETYIVQHGVLRYIINKKPASYLLACFVSAVFLDSYIIIQYHT